MLRQRRLRIVLRDLQEGTYPHPSLEQRRRGPPTHIPLGRGLLQPAPPTLHTQLLDTPGIRARLPEDNRPGSLNRRLKKREHSRPPPSSPPGGCPTSRSARPRHRSSGSPRPSAPAPPPPRTAAGHRRTTAAHPSASPNPSPTIPRPPPQATSLPPQVTHSEQSRRGRQTTRGRHPDQWIISGTGDCPSSGGNCPAGRDPPDTDGSSGKPQWPHTWAHISVAAAVGPRSASSRRRTPGRPLDVRVIDQLAAAPSRYHS